MPQQNQATREVVDSATAVNVDVKDKPAETKKKGKGRRPNPSGDSKGGKNKQSKDKQPAANTSSVKSESSSNKSTPGFSEGNSALTSYGLSVSGRKERIVSLFKADKFFHFVEQSWEQLIALKPAITDRFSLAEFRHISALQLYSRIEAVKFDALGIKPPAPTRIPLPRNTRVFQPIWSILANIGTVDDDELRVLYIPDGSLPVSDDLSDPKDIDGLLSCTLYDWFSSWEDVKTARAARPSYASRLGIQETIQTNESSDIDPAALVQRISTARRTLASATKNEANSKYKLIDGYLYRYPLKKDASTTDWDSANDSDLNKNASNIEMKKTTSYHSVASAKAHLDELFLTARKTKSDMITPRFEISREITTYRLSDGVISSDPGAYGSRLHWDPQLWLSYEQFVETVTPMAMFSLSMPAESTGTYAWLLPTEKLVDEYSVLARLPKASIPPVTWILSLLLQSSTLTLPQRSTFYTETDRLSNVLGLRQRYIRAAIKDPLAVEQFGTY